MKSVTIFRALMTQGTNVVNSWKHFERIFVEETLMEYLWARIYGAGDAKSADTLKGNLEAAPHKLVKLRSRSR